jgi:uracil-DNA glycosylase family 4
VLLYRVLHRYGLSSKPESTQRGDALQLHGCRITNAVKCLPPGNRPIGSEVRNCIGFIGAEIQDLPKGAVILALGQVAHDVVMRVFELKLSTHKFRHGGELALPDDRILLSSYHCSRYNTQTRRLTEQMFTTIVSRAKQLSGLV